MCVKQNQSGLSYAVKLYSLTIADNKMTISYLVENNVTNETGLLNSDSRLLRTDRVILLMNLCGALLIGYIIFLSGVTHTGNRVILVGE